MEWTDQVRVDDDGLKAESGEQKEGPRKGRGGLCWLVALLLMVSSEARADYKTSYCNGLGALEEKSWEVAVQSFQRAIEQEPKAERKKIVRCGTKHRYTPYYYLGLAFYRAGELRQASEAWLRSKKEELLAGKEKKKRVQVNEYLLHIQNELDGESMAERTSQLGEEVAPPGVASPPRISAEELAERRRSVEEWIQRAEDREKQLKVPALQPAFATDPVLNERRRRGLEKLHEVKLIYEEDGASASPLELEELHARAVDLVGVLDEVHFFATGRIRELAAGEQALPSGGAVNEGTPADPGSGRGVEEEEKGDTNGPVGI